MKITLENPLEGFAAEARIGVPKIGEWALGLDGRAYCCTTQQFSTLRIILTPLPAPTEKRVERCEVQSDRFGRMNISTGGYCKDLYTVVGNIGFRGCVYRHPNGREKTFGFCHPIFVRAASEAPDWDWSHAQTKQHTHLLCPVAVLMEI